jgi:ubiquinol-cytochrome c reductase cytochrome c1 subunit
MNLKKLTAPLLLTLCLLAPIPAQAAGGAIVLPEYEWSFSGVFGTYDKPQLQRGFQVYKEVCSSCHGLTLKSYRNLSDLGYSDEEIKAFASQFEVWDGPNDEGDMFKRPALPSDKFVPPFPNKNAARAANNGAYPPDMSLIIKARPDGANYLKALLMGYDPAPEGFELPAGVSYNSYFPGHKIAMAQPLTDGQVTYADGTPNTLDQMSSDVTAFLAWAAEPEMEERKQTGVRVMLFLIVLTGLLYLLKKRIWSDVH